MKHKKSVLKILSASGDCFEVSHGMAGNTGLAELVYCIAWTDKETRKVKHAMLNGNPLCFLEEQTANEALGHMRIRISKLRQAIAKHKLKGDNKHG